MERVSYISIRTFYFHVPQKTNCKCVCHDMRVSKMTDFLVNSFPLKSGIKCFYIR